MNGDLLSSTGERLTVTRRDGCMLLENPASAVTQGADAAVLAVGRPPVHVAMKFAHRYARWIIKGRWSTGRVTNVRNAGHGDIETIMS
jgi:hypothetical protein